MSVDILGIFISGSNVKENIVLMVYLCIFYRFVIVFVVLQRCHHG